jgi:hypothetical protein
VSVSKAEYGSYRAPEVITKPDGYSHGLADQTIRNTVVMPSSATRTKEITTLVAGIRLSQAKKPIVHVCEFGTRDGPVTSG